MRLLLCLLLTVCAGAGIVDAEDGPKDWPVRAEVVPVERLSTEARQELMMARSLDYAYVDRASGNQKAAIEAYKRYLALAPTDEPAFTLQPMSRICYLYANTYDTDKGETYRFGDASDWCRRVLELAAAHDIVSVEVTDLRKLYMTCSLDRLERVKRIAENYRWYAGLTEEGIKRSLAACDKYGRYAGENPRLKPSFPEDAERQFRGMIESVKTRCLDKIGETVTYAKEVKVLGAILREFREEDLGSDLWQRVQEKKTQLINEHLDIERTMDDSLPKSGFAAGHSPAAGEAQLPPAPEAQLPVARDAHLPAESPKTRQGTGRRQGSLFAAIGASAFVIAAGVIWATKRYRARRRV